jgi:hypothetical protein
LNEPLPALRLRHSALRVKPCPHVHIAFMFALSRSRDSKIQTPSGSLSLPSWSSQTVCLPHHLVSDSDSSVTLAGGSPRSSAGLVFMNCTSVSLILTHRLVFG